MNRGLVYVAAGGAAIAALVGAALALGQPKTAPTNQGTNSQGGLCPEGSVPFANMVGCPAGWTSVQTGCCVPGIVPPPPSQPPESIELGIPTPQISLGAPIAATVTGALPGDQVEVVWAYAPVSDASAGGFQPLQGGQGSFDAAGTFAGLVFLPAGAIAGTVLFIAALDVTTGVFSDWLPITVLPPSSSQTPVVTINRIPNASGT